MGNFWRLSLIPVLWDDAMENFWRFPESNSTSEGLIDEEYMEKTSSHAAGDSSLSFGDPGDDGICLLVIKIMTYE